MTGAAHPTDFRPVIALFCTRGMEVFLANAIQGILQTGIEAGQIHVGSPFNALRSVKAVDQAVLHRHPGQRRSGAIAKRGRDGRICSFGSRLFTDICWKKVFFIRQLIELHPHVVYADVDVSWMRNPLPYLIEVALVFPIAIQTEGLPQFPPALCWSYLAR